MQERSQADHDYKISVGTVVSVARRTNAIFASSKPHEKRQFINFFVQDPQLKERGLVFELRKPMKLVLELADFSFQKSKTTNISVDRPAWLGNRDNPLLGILNVLQTRKIALRSNMREC